MGFYAKFNSKFDFLIETYNSKLILYNNFLKNLYDGLLIINYNNNNKICFMQSFSLRQKVSAY
jgi:hypothetical protein